MAGVLHSIADVVIAPDNSSPNSWQSTYPAEGPEPHRKVRPPDAVLCGGCHSAAYLRLRTIAALDCLAGWLVGGGPRSQGPGAFVSALERTAQERGAQHAGVLYFSLRLKLLASETASPFLLPTTQPVRLDLH